jgi:hypothetical protein
VNLKALFIKNLKGRVLGFVLRTIGKRVLERAFENSVKAIEARNSAKVEICVREFDPPTSYSQVYCPGQLTNGPIACDRSSR